MIKQQVEFTKYISPDGQIYNFDNKFNKFVLGGLSNLGMPDISYRTERGPFQDGVTPLGFVLEPRVVTMLHRYNGGCRQDYWDNRQEILNMLRPNRQSVGSFETGELVKILPDGSERRLSALIQEGPKFPGIVQGRWDEFSAQDTIRFIAHDPLFYDPNLSSQALPFATNLQDLIFPFTFPFFFLENSISNSMVITYTGTYKSFPTILLTGPMRNPKITNQETGEKIELSYYVAGDDVVTITLAFSNKTIVNSDGDNLLGTLTTDSDLATFHLASDPEITNGINTILVETSNTSPVLSSVTFEYFTRYIGI